MKLVQTETRRKCGECTLCCKLLPMPPLHKAAGERCEHQRHGKGCAIYARRPRDCMLWNCRWLVNDDTDRLSRPDRSHYVIDIMPDFIKAVQPDGTVYGVPVLQIWVDPTHPHAHRDPALRAYLIRRGEEGFAALIRYDESAAFLLVPPAMNSSGDFLEHATNNMHEESHTGADIFDFFNGRMPAARPLQ